MWVLMLWVFLVSISWLPCGGRWRSAWRPVYWRGKLWARRSASLLPSLSLHLSLSLSLSPSHLFIPLRLSFVSFLSPCFLVFVFRFCPFVSPPLSWSLSLSPFLFSSPTRTLSSPPPACLVSLSPTPICPLYTLSLCQSLSSLPPPAPCPHPHLPASSLCPPPRSALFTLPLSVSLLSSPTRTLSSSYLPALSLCPPPLFALSPSVHLSLFVHLPLQLPICVFVALPPLPTSPIPSSAVRDWSLTVWCSLCSAYPCRWRVPVYRGWCLLIFQVLFL